MDEHKAPEAECKSAPSILYLKEFVYLMVTVILLLTFVFRMVVVSGPSMNSTLVHGDCLVLLSNLFCGKPKAGDVVVISKKSYDDGKPIIKRVIAVEGQVVDIDFQSGVVYVDGIALDEPYANTPTNLFEGMEFPVQVEDGCIFVLGDNRNKSKDSRNPDIGQIDTREVLGKALLVVFPGQNEEDNTRDIKRIGVIS